MRVRECDLLRYNTIWHTNYNQLESRSWRGLLDTTLCNKVRQLLQLLATDRWFSPSTPASFTNKTEILLKEALNTIPPPPHLTAK